MARSANSENIKRDEEGPDYATAISLIRGALRSNEADQRSLAQDNGQIYKRIDKHLGVHPGAARQFASIDRMAADKRTDFLRSLLALLNFAGYDNFDDLVDRAQKPAGKKPSKASEKSSGGPKAQVPDAIDDDGPGETVDLKRGWIVGADGNDIREATPEELAAERERQADFEAPGNIHPFPGAKTN